MARISADYNKLNHSASAFDQQAKRIRTISDDIQNTMRQIPLSTTYFTAAKLRMALQCLAVNDIGDKYQQLSSCLENIQTAYQDADHRAMGEGSSTIDTVQQLLRAGIDLAHDITPRNWLPSVDEIFRRMINEYINDRFRHWGFPYTSGAAKAIANFLNPAYGIGAGAVLLPSIIAGSLILSPKKFEHSIAINKVTDEGLKLLNSGKGSFKGPFEKKNDSIKDSLKKDGLSTSHDYNNLSKKQGLYDESAKQKYSEEELSNRKAANQFMDREAEVEIVGRQKEYSVLGAKGSVTGKYGSLEGEVKVLTAEGHAGAGIGEYTTKSADGKTHHGVGLYGEIGGSASAMETEIKGRLGSENLGVYGKAEGKVLSGSATAGGNIGIVDGVPQAYVGASAEAVLVEGSVSGGVNVGGAEVGVKATGKVGIGAKANVGIKDGHIVVDAGLAIGVGGEISLDIDISKPAQVISSGLQNSGKAIKGAAEGLLKRIF